MQQVVLTIGLTKFPQALTGEGPWEVEELNSWFEKGWRVVDVTIVPFANNTAGGVFVLKKAA